MRTVLAPDKVVLDFNEKPPAAWLFALWGRRWVRVALISVALLIGGATVWYQTVVKPTLTATRLTVSVEGVGRNLVFGVDDEAGTVLVSGGQNGLSEFVLSEDSILVLATEVGVTGDAEWVVVPLSVVDERMGAFASSRVVSAISRGVKECRVPGPDATTILNALLAAESSGARVSLCGTGWGHVDGQHMVVRREAVRPSELGPVSTSSVVAISETASPDMVLEAIDRLFR